MMSPTRIPVMNMTSSQMIGSTVGTIIELTNTTSLTMTSSNYTTTTTGGDGNGSDQADEYISNKRFFMHMIGGWLLTAIFLFGIFFMVITHFLGRREWRKYQSRLQDERNAVNHIMVDPKFMKYTQKGWRQIVFSA